MKLTSCLTFCALAMLANDFKVVDSNSILFVKLDEFENYEGLLSNHMKCDRGKKCDPSFTIKVIGPWGETENESGCFNDKNFIKFGGEIGSDVSNPLSYPESSLHFPITLDIRVKDCLFGTPNDEIADFYQQISDLPSPFHFSESVDPEADTERVRKLELPSIGEAPVSIKLRVIVWHKCAKYYYGNDCAKFCKTSVPYQCNNNGVPVCVSAACQTTTTPAPTTRTSTTQTSSVATTTTVNPTTTLITSTTSTVAKTTTDVNPRTTISIDYKRSMASTQTWPSTSQQSTKLNVILSTSATTATKFLEISKSALPSEANANQSLQIDSSMLITMGAILVAMLLAVVTVLVLLKQCAHRRVPPVASTSVRFNRDEIGGAVSITDQNYLNPTVYAYTLPPDNTQAPEQSRMIARPDSGVYEDPVDPGERALPPVPSRNQCNSFARHQS